MTWKQYRPFVYRDKRTYRWRTSGTRWELLTGSGVVAKVLPEGKYLGMWRIDLDDGSLSDMVNLSRAKDAAVRMADARVGKTLFPASPMREMNPPALREPSAQKRLPGARAVIERLCLPAVGRDYRPCSPS